MLTFGLNYDIKPGFEKQFEEYTAAVIDAMQAMEGHEDTRLYVDVAKPGSYMIYSNWGTREQFMAFIQSEAFRSAQQGGAEMLAGPPRHSVYSREQMMGGPPGGGYGGPPAH